MVFIYILQLEQGKYYIGKTTNPKMRLENHFDLTGSSWTKKYKPINIYAIIPDCDNYDEDKYTKIYMEKFGIDNVRGGSYCQIELNKEVKKIIEHGINASNDNCYHCSLPGHFANSCPNKKILELEAKQEVPNIKTQINKLPNTKIHNCNYCKKECPDKEYLMKHLSIYCKEKLRLLSDNMSSSDNSYKKVNDNKNSVVVNLNISNQKCNRCGRNGHLKDNCFASSFENGKPINNNFYKSKLKKNIIK